MTKVPDPSTTLDFGPLLELRAEYDRIGAELIARIEAGDPVAVAEGLVMVAREESIVDALDAKLQTLYVDAFNDEQPRRTLADASDGFRCGHLCDRPDDREGCQLGAPNDLSSRPCCPLTLRT